ncbi:hypothetical protein GGR54DRAFT_264601 [Hypoxylon sp. NC1633]|nr:hypothetical protein GGR54DRAFT_264601 [Hypoxylon sp. NC1633]
MISSLAFLLLVLPAFLIATPVKPHYNVKYGVGDKRWLTRRFENSTSLPTSQSTFVPSGASTSTFTTSSSSVISITSGTSSTVSEISSTSLASSLSSSSASLPTSSPTSTASDTSTTSSTSTSLSAPSFSSSSSSLSSTASSTVSTTLPPSDSAGESSSTDSKSSQTTLFSASDSTQSSSAVLTSFPAYVAPSSTTLNGAQETSESKKIAPLFLWLSSEKDLLQDPKRKQEYVDNVKRTNDEVVALFKSLDTQPVPEPDCGKTALKRWAVSESKVRSLISERHVVKRSLVSGILDQLDSAAKLLSCATKITGNLVNTVTSTEISTDVVQTLTDSLKDVEEALQKEDDGLTSSPTETPSSTTTSSASCTQSSVVPYCTETISLSTIFSAEGTTTTSSIKTVTTTACETVTACSATATTVTTTASSSSTTSSSAWVCEPTSCSTCSQSATRKRADLSSGEDENELDPRASFPMADLADWKGEEDDYFFQRVQKGDNVKVLDWNHVGRVDPLSWESISLDREFDSSEQVTWIDGIAGCTVLVAISKKGLWFAHLFEGGFVERNPQETSKWARILQDVQNGGTNFILPATLAANDGILSKDNDVQIYIHTPAVGTLKVDPDNTAARYKDKVNQISDHLFGAGTPFEGIEVKINTYKKPADYDPNLREVEYGDGEIGRYGKLARFKVMVEYSPALKYKPDNNPDNNPDDDPDDDCTTKSTAKAYRVWLEKNPIYPLFWDIIPGSTNNAKRQACSIRTMTTSGSATASPTSSDASNPGTLTTTGSASKSSSTSTSSENSDTSSPSSSVTVTSTTSTASKPSTQMTTTSSVATETPAPLPPQGLHCAGSGANKFLSRDDLNDKIGKFCSDAAAQKVHDKDSGSITRIYNGGTRYEVHLGIDWPQDIDISDNMEADCKASMTQIMDNCDGNDPGNPLDWKYGGHLGNGAVQYDIIPWVDQGYTPGECSFHMQEDESWFGVDGPGTERTWKYHIERATMKDGAGNTISTVGFAANGKDADPQSAGDGSPLVWSTNLPDTLSITPEAQGNPRDYVQFTIGSQSWTTNDPDSGRPRCNVGGWSSHYSPANRNMDCFFAC